MSVTFDSILQSLSSLREHTERDLSACRDELKSTKERNSLLESENKQLNAEIRRLKDALRLSESTGVKAEVKPEVKLPLSSVSDSPAVSATAAVDVPAGMEGMMKLRKELEQAIQDEQAHSTATSRIVYILDKMGDSQYDHHDDRKFFLKMLEVTEAGKVVNKIRKHINSQISEKAKALISSWKQSAAKKPKSSQESEEAKSENESAARVKVKAEKAEKTEKAEKSEKSDNESPEDPGHRLKDLREKMRKSYANLKSEKENKKIQLVDPKPATGVKRKTPTKSLMLARKRSRHRIGSDDDSS
eukprot:GILK01007390.1.p1 GENE.GILK01007390.1~~GILK01007390.1.p1  ORF type:complete len:302 (-),score=55.51 GILK01007390.1:133-1038(-)